jgi:hypothetical protein
VRFEAAGRAEFAGQIRKKQLTKKLTNSPPRGDTRRHSLILAGRNPPFRTSLRPRVPSELRLGEPAFTRRRTSLHSLRSYGFASQSSFQQLGENSHASFRCKHSAVLASVLASSRVLRGVRIAPLVRCDASRLAPHPAPERHDAGKDAAGVSSRGRRRCNGCRLRRHGVRAV